jgi:hypothetical protein
MSDAFPRGFRHQWWCLGASAAYGLDSHPPCTCVDAWVLYERTRCMGMVVPRPLPTAIVEGPPCLVCAGTAEHTDPDGVRQPCAGVDGTRHPACRGNGGGRMSPLEYDRYGREAAALPPAPGP